ncbi:glutathione S-transferase family protein [Azospirillum halopraeferens]|uniref:glutathione S-transferase family protein n=1 Tax=Azospirillum halopraeferens TaxID=34010 RepID=UPI00040769A8|nr:glutathione S-transferase family protein [Azospirillum halopraeferens]
MLRLYDNLSSGNGYKCRLLLHKLDIPYERIELDIDRGETRTPAFLARNPNGRIPALELEDGTVLPESNAILWYLAEGTPFLPDDRLGRAQVLQWMFFEQYSHEPNIATVRFWITHHVPMTEERTLALPTKRKQGYDALGVMEGHLEGRDYFVGGGMTIADVALYAYTHVAHEGGFDLGGYPRVRAWIDRITDLDRHIPITRG